MSERKYLRADEIERLRQAWKSWYRADRNRRAKYYWAFLVILHTGARIREALSVTDADFSERDCQIKLKRLKLKKSRKSSKDLFKIIPIHETAMDEILTTRLLAAQSGMLTPSYLGFYFSFKHCASIAGLDSKELAKPHAMRHSYAKWLLDQGIDASRVKKLLGHASLNSTLVYLDETPEDIGEAMRQKGLLRQ